MHGNFTSNIFLGSNFTAMHYTQCCYRCMITYLTVMWMYLLTNLVSLTFPFRDSKVHGANMGPSGADRAHVDPMLAPWTLLSGFASNRDLRPVTYRISKCKQNGVANKFKGTNGIGVCIWEPLLHYIYIYIYIYIAVLRVIGIRTIN